MPLYASDVLYMCKKYLGYTEKDNNATLEDDSVVGNSDYTKFGYTIDTEYSSFYDCKRNAKPWSQLFVHYCLIEAFGLDQTLEVLKLDLKNDCYTADKMLEHYKENGMFGEEPALGAQMFLKRTDGTIYDTTGFVVKVNADSVVVISGDTGDAVKELRYEFGSSNIAGYGYPLYTDPAVEAIKIHVTPPDKTWELDEIRYNKFDLTAAGSMSISDNEGEDGGQSIVYDPANGPLIIFVKQVTLPDEESIDSKLRPIYGEVQTILADPIAYDKTLHPALYTTPGGEGGDGDGGEEETETLKTPLISLLLDVITPCVQSLGYGLNGITIEMDGSDTEKQIEYVQWIKYSASSTLYLVVLMPGFTYYLHFDDDEAFWDGWLFNKPALGILYGAQRLYDKYQNIEVNAHDFHNTTGATEIYLANSNLYGDIEGFSESSSLRYLYAAYSNLYGELSSFHDTPIEILSLFSTSIECDIAQLGQLSTVQRFNINSTKVYGDLEGISNMTNLRIFDISDTEVYGNLTSLAKLYNLEEIWLHEKIVGDLKTLLALKKLTKVYMNNMDGVTGDIATFAGMPNLKYLVIALCPTVHGNITSLSGLENLEELRLTDCVISGAIDQLVLPNLRNFHLDTMKNLSGSIDQCKSNMPKLFELSIVQCPKITGSLGSVVFDDLMHLSLTNNAVTGNLESMQTPKLEFLGLHEMKTGGNIDALTKYPMRSIALYNTKNNGSIESLSSLSTLNNLGLNDVNVSGDVSSANNISSLQHFKVNETKVYGRMTSLKNKNLSVGIFFGERLTGTKKELENTENRYHGNEFVYPMWL